MARLVGRALLVSLAVSVSILVLSIALGTRNIPAIAESPQSDLLAGMHLLRYFAQNPKFAFDVLLPIFLPLLVASFTSALLVSKRRDR